MAWVKLYSDIVDSSIWYHEHDVVRVWIFLLSQADADGYVSVTIPAMAHQCMISIERLHEILRLLESPDAYSRTSKDEGRRIRIHREPRFAVEIVNYRDYRTRDRTVADRVRRHRERRKILRNGVTPLAVTQAEAEVEVDNNLGSMISDGGYTLTSGEKEKKHISTVERKNSHSAEEDYEVEFELWWGEYPKRAGGNPRKAAYQAYVARRKAGVSAQELLDGVRRYRRYCQARGIVGTEFVKQAQFWLSPRYEGWIQDWTAEEQWSSLGIPDDKFIDG
ncbi:MAG: hypothetical protein KatS3mg109_0398 [Pirellulaceae bacterium]|nr:MAG: hypothetical protein KatS3mg109_0398 [Pirellulaceae bacterium]